MCFQITLNQRKPHATLFQSINYIEINFLHRNQTNLAVSAMYGESAWKSEPELVWHWLIVKSDLLMMSDAVPCLPFLAPQSPVMALCKGKGLMVVPSLPVSPHCLLGHSSIIEDLSAWIHH